MLVQCRGEMGWTFLEETIIFNQVDISTFGFTYNLMSLLMGKESLFSRTPGVRG